MGKFSRALAFTVALTFWALCLAASAAYAAAWIGRPLAEVLAETRKAGVSLIYSDQFVTPAMIVDKEPTSRDLLTRLSEVLAPFSLTLKQVDTKTFIVTKASPIAVARTPPQVPSSPLAPMEIVIETSRYTVARAANEAEYAVASKDLRDMPTTDEDALRVLQRLAGSSATGLSARTHVRGGYEDELLVRLDGVQLFNPFHMKDFLGLFGLIDPEIVDSVDYYSGGFPVQFGGRNSAVIDMHPGHSGDSQNLLSVSELYSRAIGSGSFDDHRGEWLVGYRRSNLAMVLSALDRDVGKPNFEDLFARFSYVINSNLKITTGFLGLMDDLDIFTADHSEQVQANYRDAYEWLILEGRWTDWLSTRAQFTHAGISSSRLGNSEHVNISQGTLSDFRHSRIDTLTLDWKATLQPPFTLQWGMETNNGRAQYDYIGHAAFFGPLAAAFGRPAVLNRNFVSSPEGWQHSAYASGRYDTQSLSVELGVRWDDQSFIHNSSRVSPRLAVRYGLGSDTTLRLNAGRYVQPQTINELGLDENTFRFSKPDSVKSLVVGVDHQLSSFLELRVEGYKKWIDDVRPRYENILDLFVLLPDLEVDRVRIIPSQSRAHGVEVSLLDNNSIFNWWMSYAWSQVTDDFNGVWRRRSWDQQHSINAGFSYTHKRWKFGTNLSWHSGWPYTPLTFTAAPEGGSSTVSVGPRNSSDFGSYSSVDLKAQYTQPVRIGNIEYFAEVRNLFNRMNECCRSVAINELGNGNFDVSITRERWLSRVPIAGVNWRF